MGWGWLEDAFNFATFGVFEDDTPAPLPPPPPPKIPAPIKFAKKTVQGAGATERAKGARAGGRASTIKTGALGVTDEAALAKKKLLGA